MAHLKLQRRTLLLGSGRRGRHCQRLSYTNEDLSTALSAGSLFLKSYALCGSQVSRGARLLSMKGQMSRGILPKPLWEALLHRFVYMFSKCRMKAVSLLRKRSRTPHLLQWTNRQPFWLGSINSLGWSSFSVTLYCRSVRENCGSSGCPGVQS